MDRGQEEDVLRITAQYVEEVRSGYRPKVGDYLARYPQYAREIADFVAYFHAFEIDLPAETESSPELPAEFRIAIDSAWERALQSEVAAPDKLITLLLTASKRHITQSQLASEMDLSVDIISKLEQRKIQASSIPKALYDRLAEVLQQPLTTLQAYFESPGTRAAQLQQLAESQALYQINEQSGVAAQSFRNALEESTQLPGEQKQAWLDVLSREGL